MKSTLNNACISALLCGAVLIAIPAMAAGAGSMAGAAGTTTGAGMNANGMAAAPAGSMSTKAKAGMGASNGGMTTSGEMNTTTDSNAGGMKMAAHTSSHRMSHKAMADANTAEMETTRQLNQQAAMAARPGQ